MNLLRGLAAATCLAALPGCSDGGAHGEVGVYVPGAGGQLGIPSPLSARIEITGNRAPCGRCATLVAVVSGGVPPYDYAWTDPALTGPGPHLACPRKDERYAVVVTDSGAAIPGLRRETAVGTALVECIAGEPDAGEGGGLNGCIVPPALERIDCPSMDGAIVSSHAVEFTIESGRTYQYTYTQLLPIGLGETSTVDVYLGMNPCDLTQKTFTLRLDSTVTQSYCFTPRESYRYSTDVIRVNGIPLTFGVTPTICDSCRPE